MIHLDKTCMAFTSLAKHEIYQEPETSNYLAKPGCNLDPIVSRSFPDSFCKNLANVYSYFVLCYFDIVQCFHSKCEPCQDLDNIYVLVYFF